MSDSIAWVIPDNNDEYIHKTEHHFSYTAECGEKLGVDGKNSIAIADKKSIIEKSNKRGIIICPECTSNQICVYE